MPAFLEITTLGCRNLVPFRFLPITLPRVEFVLETAEETFSQSTPDSKHPSPQNPNYLRYDVIEVPKFPKKVERMNMVTVNIRVLCQVVMFHGLPKPELTS